jgi:hypothetical protein
MLCFQNNIKTPPDITIARLHKHYNIYGYKYPFFFQSEKLGNTWWAMDATNFRF